MYAVEISTLPQIAPFICFNNYNSKSNKSSTLDIVRAPLTELVCVLQYFSWHLLISSTSDSDHTVIKILKGIHISLLESYRYLGCLTAEFNVRLFKSCTT